MYSTAPGAFTAAAVLNSQVLLTLQTWLLASYISCGIVTRMLSLVVGQALLALSPLPLSSAPPIPLLHLASCTYSCAYHLACC
jgi:hypothetical protein